MKPSEFLHKAEAAARSAQQLFASGDLDGAANRAYYAMFHAARAALLHAGEGAVGKHGFIIGSFGRKFVKDGPLPAHLGRGIHEAQRLRSASDYRGDVADRDAVKEAVATADEFVRAIRRMIFGASTE